ncbi:hypothetical protein [Aneurinibacillus soli]|nr:hypothetical protein [Aneurinibacillus soli]
MTLTKLITHNYEWTVFFLFLVIIIFLGYKTEDAVFWILGKYSFKIVKSPYNYIISLTVVFSYMYFVLNTFP